MCSNPARPWILPPPRIHPSKRCRYGSTYCITIAFLIGQQSSPLRHRQAREFQRASTCPSCFGFPEFTGCGSACCLKPAVKHDLHHPHLRIERLHALPATSSTC
ncbi:hypothetical protein K431DRAFT_121603 [Polychaeton citri CBS 116435]|uniref:Uncharacterized protein n=1 Tax=Polychaeton citri CBS 116435 TaxID=1314669 RepID=A0A9P4UKL5_9PEZI|nr:hypothetical protein K431DRAFT_121603 [Polychaeton citri CBS 116435]